MTEPLTDDATLVQALAGGDHAAARELYRRHSHAILRFAMAMTNGRAMAEDIVHDTFVELLHRPRNYDPAKGSLRAFLYGIARHRVAKAVGGWTAVSAEVSEDDAQPHAVSTDPSELTAIALVLVSPPEDQLDRVQQIELLRMAMRDLPLIYREVIAWCDLEEVPYATVADILGCPIGTVRSRLHRARALLAETFQSLWQRRDAPRRCHESGTPLTPALKGGST
jgi:RNA polymerase sigma-70 factor, ECF subfamily